MHRYIPKTIFLAATVIFVLTVGVSLLYLGASVNKAQREFSVFYSKGTITKFNAAGNPLGYFDIYRLDSMTGVENKIYTSPDLQHLPAQMQYLAGKLSGTFTSSPDMFIDSSKYMSITTQLDKHGQIVNVSTDKESSLYGNVVSPKTAVSPDGRYAVTSFLSCVKQESEGPCQTKFSLRIYDSSALATQTIEPKAFNLSNGSAMKVELLDFISNTAALVQVNDAQELYRQIIGRLDLATGKIDVIWKNMTSQNSATGQTLTFQWLQPNKNDAIMLERNTQNDTITERFVSFDLLTMNITSITDQVLGLFQVLARDLRGYYYYKDFNQGEWYHDLASNSDRQVTIAGDTQDFNPNNRFIPITVYESSNGLGPKKVVIQDLLTNKVRLVFDQTGTSQGLPTNVNIPADEQSAKIGDVIYSFIGIEQ